MTTTHDDPPADEPVRSDSPGVREAHQAKLKELARTQRRAAYQRAKAAAKASRQAQAKSPQAEERRRQAKEQRRAAYLKAKEAHKTKSSRLQQQERQQEQEAERAARAEKEQELLATLTTADQLEPPKAASRSHLRLVKSDKKPDEANA